MANVILLNKPYNVLCQFSDDQGRSTLRDFVDAPGYYPAGRLDRDSEGLVILTDDGKLQNRIASPDHATSKTYWVQVEGIPNDADLTPIRAGMLLKDGETLPARCKRIDQPYLLFPRQPPIRFRKTVADSWLEITLHEGRNRQLRRMCAAIGFPALRLIRYRVGSWTLDGIQPGEYRKLVAR